MSKEQSETKTLTLQWKVHTTGLLKEVLLNVDRKSRASLAIPLQCMINLLGKVGERAAQLNDPELNKLMIRMCLYSIANPDDPEYNPELVSKILGE